MSRAGSARLGDDVGAEQSMAAGIVIGLVAGGLVGWLGALLWGGGQIEIAGLLVGAFGGGVAGLLAGSYAGLATE